MAKITLINGDAAKHGGAFDMILTDPPFDMSGKRLAEILSHYDAPHLLLITTVKQLLEFAPLSGREFCFDFVLDAVVPKQSKSLQQPHYVHATGAYFRRPGVKSAFNRKRRPRSDGFLDNGYWPTIFRAPRGEGMREHGQAKNSDALTDILGSFDVRNIVDPFAGIGSSGIAASALGIDCTLIEQSADYCRQAAQTLKFLGNKVQCILDI